MQGLLGTAYNEIGLPLWRGYTASSSNNMGGTQNIKYSADGVKLFMSATTLTRQTDTSADTLTQDRVVNPDATPSGINYVGNLVLSGSNVVKTLFEGGYIDASGKYVFLLPDHLGNVMVAAKATGAKVQSFHYFPYGDKIAATPSNLNPLEEPYRFAGNEIDMFNNYDFHARWYNPAVGRFTTPDPLAEKYYSLSPYIYCADNPVNLVDPDGDGPHTYWIYLQTLDSLENTARRNSDRR